MKKNKQRENKIIEVDFDSFQDLYFYIIDCDYVKEYCFLVQGLQNTYLIYNIVFNNRWYSSAFI